MRRLLLWFRSLFRRRPKPRGPIIHVGTGPVRDLAALVVPGDVILFAAALPLDPAPLGWVMLGLVEPGFTAYWRRATGGPMDRPPSDQMSVWRNCAPEPWDTGVEGNKPFAYSRTGRALDG